MSAPAEDVGFPRLHARTRRFTLGRPRAFALRDDGTVLFLRSAAGDDPVTSLWRRDPDGTEHVLVDARDLDADDAALPAEERARRERAREQAGGIVAYSSDRARRRAAFGVGGRLHVVEVDTGAVTVLDAEGVFSPTLDPTGARVCWVAERGLWVADAAGGDAPRRLCHEEAATVTWGAAEFVAAEEMGRMRGAWWSPDGRRLAVARVDVAPVEVWRISDPSDPAAEATEHRYPPAGSANADVSLHVVDLDGTRVEVTWDRADLEYLAAVRWDEGGRLSLLVQSRDQRTARLLVADPDTGGTTLVRELVDEAWVSLVPGTPAWCGDDPVLVVPDDRGEHGSAPLDVGGEAVTPAGLQVRAVLRAEADGVWFAASDDDPSRTRVWRWRRGSGAEPADLRPAPGEPGVVSAVVGATAVVVARSRVEAPVTHTVVSADGWTRPGGGPADRDGEEAEVEPGQLVEGAVTSLALAAPVDPRPRFARLGPRRCPAALFLPTADEHDRPLPVLLDPYGGPGHGRVVRSREAHLTSQWLADQGFAVLVVDNRGAPGVGPRWERGIHRDLATPALTDQVDALHAAAELEPRLDLDRVAMRGWSFGGFLAALAVLRRPDVFCAGIAGAPVTDWHLYDTHYTERYLGRPQDDPDAYAVSSLVDADGHLLGAVEPPDPDRPPRLLLVHGLADDNVVAAHALRLSAALLAAGRPHEFLPLSGVTHMTPQEVVAENLLRLQVAFLRRSLEGPSGRNDNATRASRPLPGASGSQG